MTWCRFIALGCQEGMNSREVRTSRHSEPTNTPDQRLICQCMANLCGKVISIHRRHNSVDRYTRSVWCCSRCLIPGVAKETFNEIGCKTRLVEMNGDRIRSNPPREMDPKKPLNDPHEINFTAFTKEMTEESLNCGVCREVYEVVNVKPK
jgi:hypothetical protein